MCMYTKFNPIKIMFDIVYFKQLCDIVFELSQTLISCVFVFVYTSFVGEICLIFFPLSLVYSSLQQALRSSLTNIP